MPPDEDAQQPVRLSADQETKLQYLIRNEKKMWNMHHTALLNEYNCKVLLYKENLLKYEHCKTERQSEMAAKETTLHKLNLRFTHLLAVR